MSEMKVCEFFVLPLRVNDTYAENELRDGNGDFILAMEGNAHELRLIANSVNNRDRLTEESQKLREALRLAMDTLSLLTEDAIDVSSRVNSEVMKTLICIDDILESTNEK